MTPKLAIGITFGLTALVFVLVYAVALPSRPNVPPDSTVDGVGWQPFPVNDRSGVMVKDDDGAVGLAVE